MPITVYAPQLGIAEHELAEALGNYIRAIPIPGGMGSIHTRGKHGISDAIKVMILQSDTFDYGEYGINGLFILPSEYTEPTDETAPSMGEVVQGVIYELTYIHELSEEIVQTGDDPLVGMVSFDHFRQKIDFLRRWLNNNTHFGSVNSHFWHTRLRSSQPLYDDEVPDVGFFHFGKFNLEMRYLTPTKC